MTPERSTEAVTTRTGKLVHLAQVYTDHRGARAFTECSKFIAAGKAVATDKSVNCQRCNDVVRIKKANEFFRVTISPRRLGRAYGSTRTQYGRDARCTCGVNWRTNEYQLGAKALDRKARDWADKHMLQHATELEAHIAEWGEPMACPECDSGLMHVDRSVPLVTLYCTNESFCGTRYDSVGDDSPMTFKALTSTSMWWMARQK